MDKGSERAQRTFPIQRGPAIPWAMIEPYADQARRNHGQTLERLAERGGLCPIEAIWVMEGRNWDSSNMPDEAAAHAKLVELRDEWIARDQSARIRDLESERNELLAALVEAGRSKDETLVGIGSWISGNDYCAPHMPRAKRLRDALVKLGAPPIVS